MIDPSQPDGRVTEILGLIQGLSRTRFEGEVFEDQDVFLDGRDFINCTFRRCRLHIFIGLFSFTGSQTFDGGLEVRLGGPAEGLMNLLEYLRSGGDTGGGPIQ